MTGTGLDEDHADTPPGDRYSRSPKDLSSGERRKHWLERFFDDYGIVLLLIVVLIVLIGLFGAEIWGRPVVVLLMGITLELGLAASGVSSTVSRYAGLLGLLVLAVSMGGAIANAATLSQVATTVMAAVLVTILPWAIVRGVARQTEITVRTITGAISVYLLVGLFFALVFATIGLINGSFFAQNVPFHFFDFIYFSFVTMTTVGYGDLTAAGDTGRMLAVLEALLGQIYLVTVVAMIVGNLGRQRELRQTEARRRGLRRRSEAGSEPAGAAKTTLADEPAEALGASGRYEPPDASQAEPAQAEEGHHAGG